MVIELFKQIIENIVTLEKIIIHIYGPESVKLQVRKRSRVKQLLTHVPSSVELVVL